MSSESKRELIIADIETVLGGIDGLDPYWTNVASVDRTPVVPTTIPAEDKPCALILTSAQPEKAAHKHNHQDRRELQLTIAGIMDTPSSDANRALNRFMQDVTVALMDDPARSGHAAETVIVSRQETTASADATVLTFEVKITVVYFCDSREE